MQAISYTGSRRAEKSNMHLEISPLRLQRWGRGDGLPKGQRLKPWVRAAQQELEPQGRKSRLWRQHRKQREGEIPGFSLLPTFWCLQLASPQEAGARPSGKCSSLWAKQGRGRNGSESIRTVYRHTPGLYLSWGWGHMIPKDGGFHLAPTHAWICWDFHHSVQFLLFTSRL